MSTHYTVRLNFFVFKDQLQNLNIHPAVVNDQNEWVFFFFFLLNDLYNYLLRVMLFSFNCMIFRVSYVFWVCLEFRHFRYFRVD